MKTKFLAALLGLLLAMHDLKAWNPLSIAATYRQQDDSLRKKKKVADQKKKTDDTYEKNEYPTYVEDRYNQLCTRLQINRIIDGYTDKRSYEPGDTVKLYMNVSNTLIHHTFYINDVLMNKKDSITTFAYPQSPAAVKPWENYGYEITCRYVIPATMPSGMYNLGNVIFFTVKSKTKDADITIVYPSNTEEAYNNAGGKSLYDFNSNGAKASCVSFQRPLSNFILSEVQQHSYPFMKWLKQLNGYSIQYILDSDLDHYSEIANTKLLVVIGHSEYWTKQARLNFDRFVNLGNDAAILSGNSMCWQVRYDHNGTRLTCHKNFSADSLVPHNLRTTMWTDTALNYSVLKSIGCDWTYGGYGMHANYHGNFGYTILLPNSPLLEGTGLAYHDQLACQSYEYDATLFSGFSHQGDPVVDSMALGFCKVEMLGYDFGNSASLTKYTPRCFGTFVIFKKIPGSGIVVNAGFNTFTGKTPSYGEGGICGPDSVKIRQLTLNIFSKLLNKQNVFANPNMCTVAGIKENKFSSNFARLLLYPNPGKGEFSVNTTLESSLNEPRLELYDCFGRLADSRHVEKDKISKINLSHITAGTYIYILYDGSEMITRGKLIIMQ